MNIFFLDVDPVAAARMLCDKHVVKMGLEAIGLLRTALDSKHPLFSTAWFNHPCAKWVRQSENHYSWLWSHGVEILKRYHSCYMQLQSLIPMKLVDAPLMIPPPRCMPEDCWIGSPTNVGDVIGNTTSYTRHTY
jgi:hypothetical protein